MVKNTTLVIVQVSFCTVQLLKQSFQLLVCFDLFWACCGSQLVNHISHFLTCFGHAGTTVAVSYISHFLTCIAGHTAEQCTTAVNCQNVHALCQYVSMTPINSANNSSFAQLIAFLKLAARANIGFTL